MSGFGSIAGRPHTRCAVKCGDFKAGVVGKAIISVTLIDPAGLHQRVSFKSVGRLGYVVMTPYVGKREDFIPLARYLAKLLKLMLIVGGEN